MKIVISWVARNNDPFSRSPSGGRVDGATLQFLFRSDIGRAVERCVLFFNEDSRLQAETLQKEIVERVRKSGRALEVELLRLKVVDPTDYGALYREMGAACDRILSKHPPQEHEYVVHISPGPPQAQTIWFLLVKSGLVPARMVKSVEPWVAARQNVPIAQEVSLDIAGLPQVERLRRENRQLREEARQIYEYGALVSRSAAMKDVVRRLRLVEHGEDPVLITGETGVGKEFVARIIHEHSRRRGKPFVPVNCGGLPEGTLEDALFGHVRGAFTGAESNRLGFFREADGGTLFLDEIGDLSPKGQVSLLRAVQHQEITPLGQDRVVKVDVRIVAATNKDLDEMVRQGQFRADLLRRLRVIPIHIPPLRERPDDVAALAESFLKSRQVRLSREAAGVLVRHHWQPGNVGDLENVMKACATAAIADGLSEVTAELVREIIDMTTRPPTQTPIDLARLDEVERQHIRAILSRLGMNRTRAAEVLGISRTTLQKKIRQYGLQ